MLTTAAILMSLGTEPVNSHPVSSEPIDTRGGSFAKSFDEGVALAGELPPQIVNGNASQNTGDAKSTITAQNLNVFDIAGAEAKANVDARVQGGLSGTALLLVGASGNKAATASGGAKTAATETVELAQGKGAKESTSHVSADELLDVPSDKLSAGIAEDASRKLPSAAADALMTDAAEETVPTSMDAAVSAPVLLPGDSQTRAVLNQKVPEIAEKVPTVPSRKNTKDEHGVGKTTKPAKTEKNEKAVGTAGNTVGIEAQMQLMIAVPGIAAPMDVQSSKASTARDDVGVSPLVPSCTAAGQNNGLSATVGKPDKASMGMSKINPASVKGTDAAATSDPASLKPEPDTAKTATQPATSEAGGSAKGQGGIPAVLTPALTRAESGVAGVVSGVVVGAPAAHPISAKLQSENLSSSAGGIQAGAGMLAGSGTIDGGGPIDATHKTLAASPTALEVGVPNGTHGWLKIRAEMTGAGGVNASLSTASTSGQEMLHRELPLLTAYLESERVAVNTVVIQPAMTAGTDFRGLAGGMNGDGRGQAPQGGSQGGENRQDANGTALNRAEDIRAYVGANGFGVDDLLSPASYAGGGSWLSVRA
jgi:hypothetical protein